MALDFPATPNVGDRFSTPGGGAWVWDGTKWVAAGVAAATAPSGPAAPRNFLHNPYFNIQQRTGPWTGTGMQFTADRWAIQRSNDTAGIQLSPMGDGDRVAIGDESALWALQNTFTGSSTANSYNVLTQSIESVRRLSGKSIAVSFWARATSGTPRIGVVVQQLFGTGGSPSPATVAPIGTTPALSSTWTHYSVAGTILSAVGKTFGTTANTDFTQLGFWCSDATNNGQSGIGVQSGAVQFWGVQLEIGTVSTPLEKIDPRYDLDNCLRFLQLYTYPLICGYNGSNGVVYGWWPLVVPMRVPPTVQWGTISYSNASALSVNLISTIEVRLQITVTTTGSGYAQAQNTLFTAEI